MTITEILSELPKLSPKELDDILRKAGQLRQKFIDDGNVPSQMDNSLPKAVDSKEPT